MTTHKQQSLREKLLRSTPTAPRSVSVVRSTNALGTSPKHAVERAGSQSAVLEKEVSLIGKNFRIRATAASTPRTLDKLVTLLGDRDAEVSGLRNAVYRLEATVVEQNEILLVLLEQQRALLQVVTEVPSAGASYELVDTAAQLSERIDWQDDKPGRLDVVTASPAEPSNDEAAAEREWQAIVGAGESVRQAWVDDGLLVPSSELADAWLRTPQALSQACARGELFSLKVKRNRYYLEVFKSLTANAVGAVCKHLKGDDEAGKFIFWNRGHGGLGGLTPAEAIRAGRLEKVVQLATAWSQERGLQS